VFGAFIHHNPHVGPRSQDVLEKRIELADKTRALYLMEFGGVEQAGLAWYGAIGDSGHEEMRAEQAALSNYEIRDGQAALSNYEIRDGRAALSNYEIRNGRAALSNYEIKTRQAALSNYEISSERAALSNYEIRATEAALSNYERPAQNISGSQITMSQ
jgi:hypothetical protein